MDSQFYDWVRRSRETVFSYCASLPPEVYRASFPGFGGGSIRDLHAHAAECYLDWLGRFAMGEETPKIEDPDLGGVRRLFAQADAAMDRFLERFGDAPDQPLPGQTFGLADPITLTPRWLFAHTVTHEFHHKGQIVKLGRLLGHPLVPDSDLVFPDAVDLHRLALHRGDSLEGATRTAIAAALAREVAPGITGAELERRMAGTTVEMWGLRIAEAAAGELWALPDLMRSAVLAAFRQVAADPAAGRETGSFRRFGFSALDEEWRLIYGVAPDGRPVALVVTSRARATY